VNRVVESPHARRGLLIVSQVLWAILSTGSFAAGELQHLGHERLAVEPSVGIECRQDLFPAADPDEVACSQGTRHGTNRLRCGQDVETPRDALMLASSGIIGRLDPNNGSPLRLITRWNPLLIKWERRIR
jgi:hypothetical protein